MLDIQKAAPELKISERHLYFYKNKIEKPFSLQDDSKTDKIDIN